MRESRRADVVARVILTVFALLPYWRLLTFSVVFITDDYFASDVFNGELPGRVLAGQAIAAGRLPIWTSQMCSGFPLAGSPADPIGLLLFAVLRPAPALDALIVILLLIAAHGAYSLARRLGSDRIGAVLAGVAFAGSGYIAAQLKHLSIVSTVVWLPVGLALIDRAFAPGISASRPERLLALGAFGAVFALQVLAGFPQSAYICALVYAAFALFRAVSGRESFGHPRGWLALMAALGVATVLGAIAAGIVLFPLSALGSISDRAEALGYEWSTRLAYWPPNALMFLFPYGHGDISNNTYNGPPFFWEDYGYVGFATVWLALFGALRERRRSAGLFLIAMTVLAYLFVLGQATPIFKVAYLLIPGLKLFRFPTRFLIVVELGLAILAALGLTRLREWLERRGGTMARTAAIVTAGICVLTAVDLFVHQPRQNPMLPAATWLAPPATVATVSDGSTTPRTFTPRHRDLHRRAFQLASGWADVAPYYEIRDVLEPNIGGAFWNVPSGDCYVGISPRWFVDVWGDHSRELSLMSLLAAYDFKAGVLRVHPSLPSILSTYGVTHLLSAFPAQGAVLPAPTRSGSAYVYRIDGAARTRFVPSARVADDATAATRLLEADFDGAREVLLQDAPPEVTAVQGTAIPRGGTATIVSETDREVRIAAEAPAAGFLLLADTYYPGWSATVDGQAVPLYRANLSVRAIQLPAGRHDVRFVYDPPGVRRGIVFSSLGAGALLAWLIAAAGFAWSGRSRRPAGSSS